MPRPPVSWNLPNFGRSLSFVWVKTELILFMSETETPKWDIHLDINWDLSPLNESFVETCAPEQIVHMHQHFFIRHYLCDVDLWPSKSYSPTFTVGDPYIIHKILLYIHYFPSTKFFQHKSVLNSPLEGVLHCIWPTSTHYNFFIFCPDILNDENTVFILQ